MSRIAREVFLCVVRFPPLSRLISLLVGFSLFPFFDFFVQVIPPGSPLACLPRRRQHQGHATRTCPSFTGSFFFPTWVPGTLGSCHFPSHESFLLLWRKPSPFFFFPLLFFSFFLRKFPPFKCHSLQYFHRVSLGWYISLHLLFGPLP